MGHPATTARECQRSGKKKQVPRLRCAALGMTRYERPALSIPLKPQRTRLEWGTRQKSLAGDLGSRTWGTWLQWVAFAVANTTADFCDACS